jgi:hypothetical protein
VTKKVSILVHGSITHTLHKTILLEKHASARMQSKLNQNLASLCSCSLMQHRGVCCAGASTNPTTNGFTRVHARVSKGVIYQYATFTSPNLQALSIYPARVRCSHARSHTFTHTHTYTTTTHGEGGMLNRVRQESISTNSCASRPHQQH